MRMRSQVVSFRHAAQGLEERKQILYSAGPGGRGQITAERLKHLDEGRPYALKGSPVNESPLGLSDGGRTARCWRSSSGSRRYPQHVLALGRQAPDEYGGDIRKVPGRQAPPQHPLGRSRTRTEPGDENN